MRLSLLRAFPLIGLLVAAALPAAAAADVGGPVPPDRAATPAPLPRDFGEPGQAAYPGGALPADELEARRGWLAYAQIDDARDALRLGHADQARALVAHARAVLARMREPPPQASARLSAAAQALDAGDPEAAVPALAAAQQEVHASLMTLESRLDPITNTGPFPIGGPGAYGSYGSTDGAAPRHRAGRR